MTKEEKIEKILIALKEATECGSTEWNLRDTIFNSQRTHHYRAYSIDKETYFDLEITLNENLSGLSVGSIYLWVHNKGLSDGKKQISNNPIVKEIVNLIYEKYIKPIVILRAEDDALDNILSGIADKSYMRDKRLSEILDSKEEEKETKSFFGRLFK